jgi:hypothetical protein
LPQNINLAVLRLVDDSNVRIVFLCNGRPVLLLPEHYENCIIFETEACLFGRQW